MGFERDSPFTIDIFSSKDKTRDNASSNRQASYPSELVPTHSHPSRIPHPRPESSFPATRGSQVSPRYRYPTVEVDMDGSRAPIVEPQPDLATTGATNRQTSGGGSASHRSFRRDLGSGGRSKGAQTDRQRHSPRQRRSPQQVFYRGARRENRPRRNSTTAGSASKAPNPWQSPPAAKIADSHSPKPRDHRMTPAPIPEGRNLLSPFGGHYRTRSGTASQEEGLQPQPNQDHRRQSSRNSTLAPLSPQEGKSFADLIAEGPRTPDMTPAVPASPSHQRGPPSPASYSAHPPPPPTQWPASVYPHLHPYQPVQGCVCWCHTPCCATARTGPGHPAFPPSHYWYPPPPPPGGPQPYSSSPGAFPHSPRSNHQSHPHTPTPETPPLNYGRIYYSGPNSLFGVPPQDHPSGEPTLRYPIPRSGSHTMAGPDATNKMARKRWSNDMSQPDQ
jgi:hypothetical protein